MQFEVVEFDQGLRIIGKIGVLMLNGYSQHEFILDTGYTHEVCLKEELQYSVKKLDAPQTFSPTAKDDPHKFQKLTYGDGKKPTSVPVFFSKVQGQLKPVEVIFFGNFNILGLAFFRGKQLNFHVLPGVIFSID